MTKEQQPAAQPQRLWLWKNFVNGRPEYWAFDSPYPINLSDGDPQTLGEPCGYAIFKPSRCGRKDWDEATVLRGIAIAQQKATQQPAAQPEPTRSPLSKAQIDFILSDAFLAANRSVYSTRVYDFVRAVEEAHGITDAGQQPAPVDYRTAYQVYEATGVGVRQEAKGYNRPPSGEPCSTEDWNAGYAAGLQDGKAAQIDPQEAMRHAANEWADGLTSALQWLRNIREGISTADEAIADVKQSIEHCRKVDSEARAALARSGAGK